MKRTSFFRQAGILISRYLRIFINDKQNLILSIAIPLLTILIVCAVASGDMFAKKPDEDNRINEGYPLLCWEDVDYNLDDDDEKDESDDEKDESEDENEEDDSEHEHEDEDKDDIKFWDGKIPEQPGLMPADSDQKSYYISSPGDLQFIAQNKGEWLKKKYYLSNDMDMSGYNLIPIGDKAEPFTGILEGNGHTISNFKLDGEKEYCGFFGMIGENAEIHNLGISSVEVNGDKSSDVIGIMAGYIENAEIENCYVVKSKINVDGNYIGGFAGMVTGEETDIRNCYSRTEIKTDGERIGGFAGIADNDAKVRFVYYAGELKIRGDSKKYCGGIFGLLDTEKAEYCVFDKDLCEDLSAYSTSDGEGENDEKKVIAGWSTDKLKQNSSLIRKAEKDVEKDEPNGTFKSDGEIANFSGTQTGLFMLTCVAIFVGICNSIQEICKERNILKREYMTNLRLSSYMVSKLVVQAIVCAIQNIVILLVFYISVIGKDYPTRGVILPSAKAEMFITMFLLTYASDVIALLISSVVKNSATANTFIPIILIVQIVFSGVLFDLGKAMDKLANIMISKWGIGALAATNRLNESRLKMVLENPELSLQMGDDMSRIKDLYTASASNLISIWLILIAFVVACAIVSGLLLTRVKKDQR